MSFSFCYWYSTTRCFVVLKSKGFFVNRRLIFSCIYWSVWCLEFLWLLAAKAGRKVVKLFILDDFVWCFKYFTQTRIDLNWCTLATMCVLELIFNFSTFFLLQYFAKWEHAPLLHPHMYFPHLSDFSGFKIYTLLTLKTVALSSISRLLLYPFWAALHFSGQLVFH